MKVVMAVVVEEEEIAPLVLVVVCVAGGLGQVNEASSIYTRNVLIQNVLRRA